MTIEGKTLLKKMLKPNPEERISCHDALNDIWIKMQDKDERDDELLL
jgi:hypothetical protein